MIAVLHFAAQSEQDASGCLLWAGLNPAPPAENNVREWWEKQIDGDLALATQMAMTAAATVAPQRDDGSERAIERMRQVIADTPGGKTRKPDTLLEKLNMQRQAALDALRALEEAGEYSGFSRPRPRRYS